MRSALFYLITRSYANSVLVKLRRLRQPKYLVAMLIGILWLGTVFGSFFFRRPGGSSGAAFTAETALLPIALGLTLLALITGWLSPISKGALNLNENEAAWLFAAPLSRGALFTYHFLKPQWAIFVACFFATIWWHRQTGKPQLPALWAMWLTWNLFSLHNFAMAVIWQDLVKRRMLTGILKTGALLCFLIVLVLVVQVGWQAYATQGDASTTAAWPQLQQVLAPVTLLLAPFTADSWSSALLQSGPMLALIAICAGIIVSGKTPWVEATLESIVVRQERLVSMRAGRAWWKKPEVRHAGDELFSMASTGPAWQAFLWKWGLHTGGKSKLLGRLGWVVGLLALVVAGTLVCDRAVFNKAHGDMIVLGTLLYLGVGLPGVFVFPAKMTQQLRADLDHMDFLLTLPTKPQQMLGGLMLGPLLQIIVAAVLVLSTIATVLLLRPTFPQITPAVVAAGWAGSCLVIATLIPTVTFIQCLLAIAFPGWQPTQRRAGLDNMGIGMLAMLIIFGIFALTLGVSALISWLGFLLLGMHLNLPMGILGAALVTTLIVSVEGLIAFRWASHLLWRYDPSEKTAGMRRKQ